VFSFLQEELIGKKLSEVVHPEDRERIMREVLYQGPNLLPDLYTDAGTGKKALLFYKRRTDFKQHSTPLIEER